MKEPTAAEQEQLEFFLQQLSSLLGYLPTEERFGLLLEIKAELLQIYQQNDDMAATLRPFRDPNTLLNYHLVRRGHPVLPNKTKLGCFRSCLLLLLALVLVVVLLIWVLLKSIFPLFDYNEVDQTVTIFGVEMEFSGPHHRFSLGPLDKNLNEFNAQLEMELDLAAVEIVHFQMVEGKVRWQGGALGDKLQLKCQSKEAEAQPVKVEAKKIWLRLDHPGDCQILVPPGKKLEIFLQNGVTVLKNLQNDFEVEVQDGSVSWWQQDQSIYKRPILKAETIQEKSSNFSSIGKYFAQLQVVRGKIQIR